MNNKEEQEYYTVIRKGEEIKIPASEFYSTGGLTVPSTPFIPTQEERWEEENSNTQYAKYSEQPSLNVIKDPSIDEEYPTPSAPVEPIEIPTFNMLPDNRDVATKINLGKDPYER
ncbi:MAG: hypothetical protein AAGE84_30025 [Cyanobacteria bacterium P01_G01_bin.39]